MRLAKRTAGWGALLPTEARPTHEVMDIQGSASCSAIILLPQILVFSAPESQFQRETRDGYAQNFKELPVFFLPTSPPKTVGRWQLQFYALASRGQHSSTRGQVWGPWAAKSHTPALGVKWGLSHPAQRTLEKSLYLAQPSAQGKLLHSLTQPGTR